MEVKPTSLPGVVIIEPRVFGDDRGSFCETFHTERYGALAGLTSPFVQDNLSVSSKGTVRGLHLQHPDDQGKLVMAVTGAIWDVAVDVRRGSPTWGRWVGVRLDARTRRQLWVPPGMAHGFAALEDDTIVHYKCTDLWNRDAETSVLWNDPALGIEWPVRDPILSDKDAAAPALADIEPARLPVWTAE